MDRIGKYQSGKEDPKEILKVLEKLDAERVDYKLVRHNAAKTGEEAAKVRPLANPESGVKVVFQKNPKTDKYILCAVLATHNIDNKLIAKVLNVKKINHALPEAIKEITPCIRQAHHPFGSLYGVQTYLD